MEKLFVKTNLNVKNHGPLLLSDTYEGNKKISDIIFLTVNRSYNQVIDMKIKRKSYETR